MSDREPEEGVGERPGRDPVNHRPPEEWRPGDPGDPIEGGPRPPGEPGRGHGSSAHEPPPSDTHRSGGPPPGQPFGDPPFGEQPSGGVTPGGLPFGGRSPQQPFPGDDYQYGPPAGGRTSYDPAQESHQYGGPAPGPPRERPPDQPPGGQPRYEPPEARPTEGSAESAGPGELSEGPNGPGDAGHGHQGYAPGYGGFPNDPVQHGSPGGYAERGQSGDDPAPAPPTPWGKILGIGCGVLLLLLLALGGCAALLLVLANGVTPSADGVPGSGQSGAHDQEQRSAADVTAAGTEFEPTALHTGGDYTSVEVSVTNTGEEALDLNPLYFTVVDAEGAEHSPDEAVAMDTNELGARALEPGRSASGAITVAGEVDPEYMVFEPYFTEPVRTPMS